jgi:peroxiredoxin
VSYRISYLIGRDGKVLKAYSSVKPETHAADVLVDVKRLRP